MWPTRNSSSRVGAKRRIEGRLAQQNHATVRGDEAAVGIGGHLHAFDGGKIERDQAIVGHCWRGAFVGREERRFDKEFLTDSNDLRQVRAHDIRPGVNKAYYLPSHRQRVQSLAIGTASHAGGFALVGRNGMHYI